MSARRKWLLLGLVLVAGVLVGAGVLRQGDSRKRPATSREAEEAGSLKAGEVTHLLPSAWAEREERGTLALGVESPVYWRDEVWTQKQARLRLSLLDGSIVNLGSEARLKILAQSVQTGRSDFLLTFGKFRAKVSKAGRDLEVRTTTAVIGVIGTHFYLDVAPEQTTVICLEGTLAVRNVREDIPGQVELEAGEKTIVYQGQAPTPKQPATVEEIVEAIADTTVLAPSGSDLAGLWTRRGGGLEPGGVFRFSQEEETVKAVYVVPTVESRTVFGFSPGDEILEGTREGGSLHGRLHVHYPLAMQAHCPDQWAKLIEVDLVVSEEDHTLRGRFSREFITTDCEIQRRETVELEFVRLWPNPLREAASMLAGLRWKMPCQPGHTGDVCSAAQSTPRVQTTFGGVPGRRYDVTLRFRGVVEQQSYSGGVQDGFWYTGGESAQSSYNIYRLHISDPEQTYYLNAGRAGIRRTWLIDYVKTVPITGGATVTLSADAQDGELIINRDEAGKAIMIPGLPPAPQPYDGQFIQMDVVSVTVASTPR